jgi:hypothetical protein
MVITLPCALGQQCHSLVTAKTGFGRFVVSQGVSCAGDGRNVAPRQFRAQRKEAAN